MRISKVFVTGLMLGGAAAVLAAAALRKRHDAKDLVVFITGGSRGLGLALALEYAQRGARVAICGRDDATLDEAIACIRASGADAFALRCDVREPQAVQEALRRVSERFGRLDILVNNAGTIQVGPYESMTRDDFEDSLGTHFWAMYETVEHAVPLLERSEHASIVNVTSIGGKVSVPHLLPYCVGKFAAVGYSEGLRAALASRNISVTTVVPGLMRTGSPRNAWFKGQHHKEYAWFALSDALPFFSVSAHSAARTIVEAALKRKAEVVLSLQAKMLVALEGVAPGLLLRGFALANALLPGPGGITTQAARGHESESQATASLLTALSRKAERAYNQQ